MKNEVGGISFERDLNSSQFEAVMHDQGPLLVIAGAGSGKTRTLVYRVARLVLEGNAPENILLLTFTRKAAATMLDRAARIGGTSCQRVQGGTFHGFCHRMLRRYAHLVDYPSSFTIMDQSDSQDLIHLLAKQMELIGRGKKFPSKGALCAIFSKAANSGIMIDEVVERYYPHMSEHVQSMGALFEAYSKYKVAHALMDYDDLLLKWLAVLRNFEQVRENMGLNFRYIMVDEYQDTNMAQAEIVRLMASTHSNVMAVGDDSQSIYSFRGANFKNILEFPRMFPGTRIIKLERNYRTTQPNLDCTNAIIANARQKFTKRLTAHRQGGHPPMLFTAMDENEQATFVTETILEHLKKGVEPEEIAVLFRAAFHSYQLETRLNNAGISFVKRGGMRLVDAAHVKDLVCLLRLVINPRDRLSLNRVLLLIDRLGPKSADKVFLEMTRASSPLEALCKFKGRAVWANEVRKLGGLLLSLSDYSGTLPQLLGELISWYRPYLEAHHSDDYPKRLQELAQLKAMAANYSDALELLSDLALDPPEKNDGGGESGKVVLSTMHSAKGLEWRIVFVISLAEGRFPSPMAENRPDEIEEERRLFYVASTRAKDHLYFCYPAFINVQGAGLMPARPSRFLGEIPEALLARVKRKVSEKPGPSMAKRGIPLHRVPSGVNGRQPTVQARQTGAFKAGDRVRHSIFGKGTVLEVPDKVRVKVLFDLAGEKTLRLDYTSLSQV